MTWRTRRRWPGTWIATTTRRDRTDRDVDVEDPTPGQLLDEDAPEQRPDHAGQPEHRTEQALIAATFTGRDDVADDRLGTDHQSAAAEPLDGPEGDQLDHGMAEPGQDRAGQEDDDGGLEEHLSSVLVSELAPKRR